MNKNPQEVPEMGQPSLLQQITLRVPTGTKSKYETTSGWEQFNNIEEFQPMGIAFPSEKSVNSKSVNDKSFDLSGRRIPALPARRGIYIKDGRKVMIK